ncbi:hypothetical protein [uncultured Jannaschia sp.]|uniref:hypothetical protein n=1 Tax=uncultured Jannaschia sp. TaxID=293347 RepID=UPI00261BA074|nr:hypothetical protein [uncultured Jannaschia sp.]
MKNILFASTAFVTGVVSVAQGAHTGGPIQGSLTHKAQAAVIPTPRPTPTSSGDVSAAIKVERTPLRVAPETVFFEATDLRGWDTRPGNVSGYDAQQHDLVYLWDFGDEGATSTAPVNVLAHAKDLNKGYGQKPTHAYSKPGTYTPSVLIVEPSSGKNITITFDPITVEDPDVVFAGDKTIFVSANDQHADRPSGSRYAPSFEGALNLAYGADCRIMFAAGEVFTQTGTTKLAGGHHRMLLCASPGAKPTLKKFGTNRSPQFVIHYEYASDQVIISGLRFEGNWDSTTGTGGASTGDCIKLHAQNSVNMLITDCYFTGYQKNVLWLTQNSGAASQGSRFTFHNTTVTNWNDFGLYVEGTGRFAFIGNRIAQHVDALSGGKKTDPPTDNYHGPFRVQIFMEHIGYIDGNDLFGRNGWFENISEVLTEQPIVRINQAQRHSHYHICRNTCEAGDVIIANTPMNNNITPQLSSMVVEMNYLIGSYQTRCFVATSSSGLTMRNNVCILPDTERFGAKDWQAVVTTSPADSNDGRYDAPIKIHNNTYINLSTDGQGKPFVDKRNSRLDVYEADNFTHAPRFSPAVTSQGPLDKTPRWTPRHKGYKNKGGTFQSQYATPADTVWNGAPLAGSPALGAAQIEDIAYLDLLAQVRPAYPSVGALEVTN